MGRPDELEFWFNDKPMVNVCSSMQPLVGDVISIKKKVYEVVSRNFAVDDAASFTERRVRLVCNLEEL